MGQLIPWLQVTIPGFVYTTAVFFFLLTVYNKSNLDFNDFKEYLLYIAILIVFISYVVGFAVHLTTEQILFYIQPNFSTPPGILTTLKGNNPKIYQSINDNYSNLVMFRHLVLSTSLLGIFLSRWLRNNKSIKVGWVRFFSILLVIIFSISYYVIRQNLINIKNNYF